MKNKGNCARGLDCKFSHDMGLTPPAVVDDGKVGKPGKQQKAEIKPEDMYCEWCHKNFPHTYGRGQGHKTANCPNNKEKNWICTVCYLEGHCNTKCRFRQGGEADALEVFRFEKRHCRSPTVMPTAVKDPSFAAKWQKQLATGKTQAG